jgi:hypothetical protein
VLGWVPGFGHAGGAERWLRVGFALSSVAAGIDGILTGLLLDA